MTSTKSSDACWPARILTRRVTTHFILWIFISLDRRESVVTHITEMILPFVTCSPNFIIHFHLRVDAHVNIPVQTPMFHNRPTSQPSRKSTATLRCNIFWKAHHCKSAPLWRNSYRYFLICRRSNCSEWILTVHSLSAPRRPQCRGHCWSTEVPTRWSQ
jgi:hypothetical protein